MLTTSNWGKLFSDGQHGNILDETNTTFQQKTTTTNYPIPIIPE